MHLLSKVKEKGFSGLLEAIIRRVARPINIFLYRIYSKKPLQSNLLVMESEGDFCDNAYALYDHMSQNGYLKSYRVCWLVDHPENPKFSNYENTVFVSKSIDRVNAPLMRALACCKYYIYDHNCLYTYLNLQKRPGQTIAYLTHGGGFKAAKGAASDCPTPFDKMFVTGPFTANVLCRFCNCDPSLAVAAGYPRIDYFFQPNDPARKTISDALLLKQYKKVILWMPTFRQCANASISENYIENETGLPLIASYRELQALDAFLQEKNVLLILKVHHLQANLPIFQKTFKNLMVLKDAQLLELGVQLYQLVSVSDALITDYSTIAVDYLPLDKPIIYTLDDYEDYAKSRGFYPPNAIDYMVGYHIYDLPQLQTAISEITEDIDKYQNDRKAIIGDFFQYVDGNSSARILEHLGLRMS